MLGNLDVTICLAASLGIWNSYLKPAAFWWWILWECLALLIFWCKFKAITLVNASAKAVPSCKGPGKLEWALICPTKYFLSLCLISFCESNNKEKMVVLFSGILAVSIWGNNPTIYQESVKRFVVSQMLKSPNNRPQLSSLGWCLFSYLNMGFSINKCDCFTIRETICEN